MTLLSQRRLLSENNPELAGTPKDWILVSGPPYETACPATLGSLALSWLFLQQESPATPVPQAGWSNSASAPSCHLRGPHSNHYIIKDFRVSGGSVSLGAMRAFLSSSNSTCKSPCRIWVDRQLSKKDQQHHLGFIAPFTCSVGGTVCSFQVKYNSCLISTYLFKITITYRCSVLSLKTEFWRKTVKVWWCK